MADFRWLLLLSGLLVLVVVFWLSRREQRAEGTFSEKLLPGDRPVPLLEAEQADTDESPDEEVLPVRVERVVTVRLMARGQGFPGEQLFRALRDAGLRHGRFGIFHFHAGSDREAEVFSVASLVEPGSFDLTRMKETCYPGVSLFLILSSPGDALSAFDQMLMTARSLAGKLGGDLLDEQGSRLSVQRERYLREEVIEYQHNTPSP